MMSLRECVLLDGYTYPFFKFLRNCRNFKKLGMNVMPDASSRCVFQFSAINIINMAEVRNSEEATLAPIDINF
jgi:hypothetical protein